MKYIFVIALAFYANLLQAQVFIDKGLIEYQVVVNNHKAMGEGTWAEMFKDKIPKLSTSYYQLTFDANKSIYLFNRKDEKTKTVRRVPGMGSLPFIGALFRSTDENIQKVEMVVFLTPYVITGDTTFTDRQVQDKQIKPFKSY